MKCSYRHTVVAKSPYFFCRLPHLTRKKPQYHAQASLRPFPQAQFITWNANLTKQQNTRYFPWLRPLQSGIHRHSWVSWSLIELTWCFLLWSNKGSGLAGSSAPLPHPQAQTGPWLFASSLLYFTFFTF